MEKKLENGLYPSDEEYLALLRELRPYFTIEDCRADVIRARNANYYPHPNMAEFEGTEHSTLFLDPTATDRAGLEQFRDMLEGISKKSFDDALAAHPEWNEWGYFEEYAAPPCTEEPDAPEVPILIHRLRDSFKQGPHPLLFIPAWGAFTANDLYSFMPITMAHFLGVQVMTVRARSLADGATYPQPVNDCHAAYQWLVDHAEELDMDLDRVVIYGASGLSVPAQTLPFRLKRYDWLGAPMPRGVVIEDGFFDDRGIGRAYKTLVKVWGPLELRAACMRYMGYDFASPLVGPEAFANHATVDECKGLCPYAIGCGQDSPGADGSMEFVRKLNAAGVSASFFQLQSCTHNRPYNPATSQPMALGNQLYPYVVSNELVSYALYDNFILTHIREFLDLDFRRQ